ncbi:glycosyltransferase [Nocardioides sp. W7]|uniref:glycosyltransferase family 2 protein n=1 Tax=Nocardioides sp. W7 TaxID=2931390 RepID=UPI001FD08785|nr:glycosyltransferase [Nocardioides sp. W7]
MSIDLTVVSWIVTVVVGYYFVLFLASWFRRRPPAGAEATRPLMVILVPARNEELVLEGTLESLSSLEYAGGHRVLVVDDASTDATPTIASAWAARDDRIRTSRRVPPEAGQGKSEVLNHANRLVGDWLEAGDPWLEGRRPEDIVLVIVDADGRLEKESLAKVAPYFADPKVGSVQIGVRIANADANALARMQDIEFVGFSWLVQIARDWIGSSGLGGNGQFTRLSALQTLGRDPWHRGALTEDLDLGLRLIEGGWRTRFCHLTYVDQQGLTSWRPLLRQRTRWIQGHYQCWRHLVPLARSGRTPILARLDLILYLVLVVTVVLVSYTVVVGLLGTLGLVQVTNDFLLWVPYGVPRRTVSLLLSVLPVTVFLGTYQRHSAHPFRWYQLPAAALAFTTYGYVWFFVSLRALANLVLRRNAWVKTPRLAA